MPISCPLCNKDDTIEKVSSLVHGSTFALTTAGVGIGSEGNVGIGIGGGSLTSSLGNSLSLPPRPDSSVGASDVLVGFAFILAPMCILSWLFSLVDNPSPTLRTALAVALIPSMIGGLLLFVARYMPPKRRNLAFSQARWDEHFETWNRLYYCRRDDIVFDPQTGARSAPTEMMSLL